jgi:hypothetical protein
VGTVCWLPDKQENKYLILTVLVQAGAGGRVKNKTKTCVSQVIVSWLCWELALV